MTEVERLRVLRLSVDKLEQGLALAQDLYDCFELRNAINQLIDHITAQQLRQIEPPSSMFDFAASMAKLQFGGQRETFN